MLNPNLNYVYKPSQLFKPKFETKIPIPYNTFNNRLGLTILYISKTENEDTGDDDIYHIENIDARIVPKILPQMVLDSEKYNVTLQNNHVKNFVNYLTINRNGNDIHRQIISNYTKKINDIREILLNNYDKNAFEKLRVIDDRNEIKDKILLYYSKFKNQNQNGGNGIGNFALNSTIDIHKKLLIRLINNV